MAHKIDLDYLRQWIGRSDETEDIVTAQLVRALRATLLMVPGEPRVGDAAPLTAHWCLAQPVAPWAELGPDGHPMRGGFLPPVPLPRRMWAGGQLDFFDPLRVGDVVSRRAVIRDVSLKTGRSGLLCFVTVDYDIATARGLALRERRDLVYREEDAAPAPPQPKIPPRPARHVRRYMADPVLLFRYSALTFNGHRIHYDRDYATAVEHYPGLVVHGPLQAALMAEFATELRGETPETFSYRGISPLFDGAEFSLNADEDGQDIALWTANVDGVPAMTAHAVWAKPAA